MPRKAKELLRLFDKLQIARSPSNHHIRGFVVTDDGRKLFPPIYLSKGSKEVSDVILAKLRQNLFLTREQFDTMLDCKISRSEYLNIRLGGENAD